MAISNAKLIENGKFVYAFPHGSPSTASCPYISMKNYNRLTIFLLVDKDSTGATSAITMNQATAVAGTSAKAMNTFFVDSIVDAASGTLGGAITAVGDTTASTTVTAGTFTTATTASKNALYIIEVNAKDLDQANSFDCVSLGLGNSSSSTHVVISALYYLRDPRYADALPPTSILD